ncbi:MAG TPA: Ig-like domain-containing protein [Solirubrobacteraceae bacterium]|nr:Ig-like domain-containing protein [Solirubrobacteraceae bacterium]
MVGSGIVKNGIGRLGAACVLTLAALGAGPTIAQAAPSLTIGSPSPGALIRERPTTISGTTNDTTDSVTVEVLQGGSTVSKESVLPQSGVWSVQPSLPDGAYSVLASQTDSISLEVGSAESTFTLDTTAPVQTLNAVPAVISTATPSFGGGGSQEAGDGPVHVFIDDQPVGEAAVSGGVWEFHSPALSDGSHVIRVERLDEAGNPSKPSTASFRVDTSPPSPLTLGPVPAETATAKPSFSGSGGQAEGDGKVRVLFDGKLAGEATVSGGKWAFTQSSLLTDGPHTVSVEQSDEVGNTSSTSPVTFRVDTTAPEPTVTSPKAGERFKSLGELKGGAGNAASDAAEVTVEIFHGESTAPGNLAQTLSIARGGPTWSSGSNTPSLAEGTYTVRVKQLDAVGNVGFSPAVSFTIDTTMPAPTVTAPKAEGDPLKSSLVEFKGAAGNATGDASELTVEIFLGSSISSEEPEQFTVQRSGSNWSSAGNGPRLSNGTYTVRVKQADSVGNVGFSPGVTFTVESPSPIVTLGELPRFTASTQPGFSGSAETSGEAKPEVTLKVWPGTSPSGEPLQKVTVPVVGGAWSVAPIKALADGIYTAQAEQPSMQPKNQPGVSNRSTFTIDTKAPEPTLAVISAQSDGLETVFGTAGTARGDHRQVTAELFSGNTTEPSALFETITVNDTVAEEVGSWSATFASLPSGEYTVLARQSDEAGNVGSSPAQQFTVTVPVTSNPPIVPTSPSPSPPSPSFTWVPAQPAVGQSVSLVSKSTSSSAITGYGWDLAGNGPFAAGGPVATTTFATPGPHTVRLRVTDANGLSGEVAETLQVVPQVLTLMQPFPIVRIAGTETSYGVKIKLLSVQAPPAATITISCKGRGCKTKSESRVITASTKAKTKPGAVTLSFPRFQRALKAGTVLQIRVSKAGQIGKFTSFTIRRNKLPLRVDSCLRPPSTHPSACPSQ